MKYKTFYSILPIVFLALLPLSLPAQDVDGLGIDGEVRVRLEGRSTSTNLDLRTRLELQRAEMEARREAIESEQERKRLELKARREALEREAEARRARVESERRDAASQGQEMKEANQERRVEFRREIAVRQVGNAARVLMATVERLEKILERIESRIEKVEAEGGSVEEAESFVSLAEEDLLSARASIAVLTSMDLSGENAEEVFGRVRLAARDVKDHLRSAHDNLKRAVRSLRPSED